MKRIIAEKNGITLIALVVTIIVLLILSAVSIAMLTGENGIIGKARESKEESRGAEVEELKDLWKSSKKSDAYVNTQTAQTLNELLDNLEKQKLISDKERTKIEETGEVEIGSRTIVFGKAVSIDFVKLEEKTTDTIKINIKATANSKLTYSLYTQEEGREDWTLRKTLENQDSGEEVHLLAENLSNYTYYNWYVDVSSDDDTASYKQGEKIRTYCPSNLKTCEGPFPERLQCTTCKGNKTTTSPCPGGISTTWRGGPDKNISENCRNCGKHTNRMYLIDVYCKSCNTKAIEDEIWCDDCVSKLSNLQLRYEWNVAAHNAVLKCDTCKGAGTVKKGNNCDHNKEAQHGYCEHDGKYFLTQHD